MASIFSDKLVEDNREALLTFPLNGETFGLYPPKLEFWLQLLALFFLQTFLQMVYAAFIYQTIIQPRKNGLTSSSSPARFLLGFGFIIPSNMYIPYQILEFTQVRNKTLKLSLGTMPLIVVFRCIEAMFDTSPHTVESSLGHYMVYYTSLSHFVWDPVTKKRRRWNWSEFWGILWRLFSHFHLAGVFISIAMYFDFQIFPTNVNLHHYNLSWELFTPAHLVNAYLLAVMAFCMLAVGFEMSALGDNVKGFLTHQPFYNPLLTSRSPQEFWGRKWNRTIHEVLKYGVYLPARKGQLNRHVCYLLSFLASGLLHDYSWTLMYYRYGDLTSHHPAFFKTTAFFLWNYVLMAIEHETRHWWTFFKSWPTPVVSTLVVMTALPFAHWYTGDWVASNYFGEYAMGLWLIRKI